MKLLIAFVLAGVIFFIQRFVYRKLWNKNLDVNSLTENGELSGRYALFG